MFKKSGVSPEQPHQKTVSLSHGAKAPNTTPNRPDSTKNRVIQTEKQPAGKKNYTTFTAPRKEGSGGATESGYERISMGAGMSNGKGNGKGFS